MTCSTSAPRDRLCKPETETVLGNMVPSPGLSSARGPKPQYRLLP